MNKQEIGEYLYRYYHKRTASFLANIYKASITTDARDIHRARLDVKKIFALYGLFEMLDPTAFKHQGGYKLFRPLYRQAGKIREIQVMYLLLSNPQPPGVEYDSFKLWLKERERHSVRKFIQLVKKFKESELTETDKVIKKICYSNSIVKVRSKTEAYIEDKAVKVNEILAAETGEKEIHKIRQHLKMMSTIATLVYSIKSGKQLDLIITELNKTEVMIGDWHDRVVLKDAVSRFLAESDPKSEEELENLNRLNQSLADYNQNLELHFMPEVKVIMQSVLGGNE